MNLDDIAPGQRLVICGKYLWLGGPRDAGPLFGVTAVVLAKTANATEDYPRGMVQLELPEGTQWPVRCVTIGPEDLTPIPGTALAGES